LPMVATAVVMISLSVKAFNGGIGADLERVDVSNKPPNWQGKDSDISPVTGALLRDADLRHAEAREAFLVKQTCKRLI